MGKKAKNGKDYSQIEDEAEEEKEGDGHEGGHAKMVADFRRRF